MARNIPEIPTASMADIAFMLLIFFLVATTMDVDSGLSRTLPPMPDEEQEQDDRIRERNIFTVRVDAQDRLLVEGQLADIRNLRDMAKEFIANPYDEAHLPEKEYQNIEYFGEVYVPRMAVISLQNAIEVRLMECISMVQNELTGAYNELRDEISREQFGQRFDQLNIDQQAAVRSYYPMRISEAEPRQTGGR
jgi:biopolymer transport protein ExbD